MNEIEQEIIEEKSSNIKEIISSFQPLDYFNYVNLHIHSKYLKESEKNLNKLAKLRDYN